MKPRALQPAQRFRCSDSRAVRVETAWASDPLAGEVELRFASSWDVLPMTPGARIGRLNFSGTACASDKPGP